MRILFVGDVVGRSGRAVLLAELPKLRAALALDAVIVNAENAAGGYGLTAAIAAEFLDAGADVLTMGNHVWDQRELIGHIDREPRIVRPLNLAPGAPGRGVAEIRTARGQRVLVLQVLGRLFMALADDPFRALDAELGRHALGGSVQAIIVDIHAEATSEKLALAHHLDGRVSLVVGTHTHVPTADASRAGGRHRLHHRPRHDRRLRQRDRHGQAGLAAEAGAATCRRPRLTPAMGDAMLCGVLVETDERTGLARRIEPVRVGHGLAVALPVS